MEPDFVTKFPNWLRWVLLVPIVILCAMLGYLFIRITDLIDTFLYGTGWRLLWNIVTESAAAGFPIAIAMFVAAVIAPKAKKLFFYGIGVLGIAFLVLRIVAYVFGELSGHIEVGVVILVALVVTNVLAAVPVIMAMRCYPDSASADS